MSVKQKEISNKPTVSITVKREFGEDDLFDIYTAYTAKKIAEKIICKKSQNAIDKCGTG